MELLELKNIAAEEVCGRFYPQMKRILDANRVKSVQDLINVMPKYPNVDWSVLDNRIKYAKHYIVLAHTFDTEPVTVLCKQYDDERLNHVDTLNTGSILLLFSPISDYTLSSSKFDAFTIEEIKKFLSLTDYKGRNYLISRLRYFSTNDLPEILTAVNMYTDQVIRQSELTDSRDENLFLYQQDEKRELVSKQYDEMVSYLLDNAKEFVWGEITDTKRRFYESSITQDRLKGTVVRDRMTNLLADYMTTSELENISKNDYKVLKRFIKR